MYNLILLLDIYNIENIIPGFVLTLPAKHLVLSTIFGYEIDTSALIPVIPYYYIYVMSQQQYLSVKLYCSSEEIPLHNVFG